MCRATAPQDPSPSSGVVFLYREGSARYAFSFAGAQEACTRIGARIAAPEQLYAAYLGGYEQCDAGWLSDQTVRWAGPRRASQLPPPWGWSAEGGGGPCRAARTTPRMERQRDSGGSPWVRTSALLPRYPIQTPREACYGDMDGFPGVRNYGVVDPDDLYDVYCYAEDLNGDRGGGLRGMSPSPVPPMVLPGPLLSLIAPCVIKGTARGRETIGVPPSQHCHRVEFGSKAQAGGGSPSLRVGSAAACCAALCLRASPGLRFHLCSVEKLGLVPLSNSFHPEVPSRL